MGQQNHGQVAAIHWSGDPEFQWRAAPRGGKRDGTVRNCDDRVADRQVTILVNEIVQVRVSLLVGSDGEGAYIEYSERRSA